MRLIDADALFKALGFAKPCRECDHALGCFCVDPTWNDVCGAMGDAPTVDAVQVVRCKDCTYYKESYEGAFCSSTGAGMPEDGYCSDGERRDEDDIGGRG